MDVKIAPEWKMALATDFEQPYFKALVHFLKAEKAAGKTIYPAGDHIFHAFDLTPLSEVKVVILGQDPYHNPGQAHGLCFSVLPGVKPPPSLQNMFKELHEDTGFVIPNHGCLESWARQGILLLNASLTVEAHKPMSHSRIGWEQFTDAVIREVSSALEGVVFLLWGRFAGTKADLIDASKHYILKAAHPSPLSAYHGFFGCKHFSKTNELLAGQKKQPIDWQL